MCKKLDCKGLEHVKIFPTFWKDFTEAESFGVNAVKDTYKKEYSCWGKDYNYWTELILILNLKIPQHHDIDNKMERCYINLLYHAEKHVHDSFSDDEKLYFYNRLDSLGVKTLANKEYN